MASNRRNRAEANSLAMERLSVPLVTDEDILIMLRKWHFKSQRVPGEAAQIRSDTLGAICNGRGRVNLCRVTSKHPAVFALLCRWLEDNLPGEFKMRFHFTSIRMEHGGRTGARRDQWCVGPSMTKSFGQFSGGQLLYWENDDGTMEVSEANATNAITFDAKREMVLFDPARCHAFEPYEGEIYSLFFFTAVGFETMTLAKQRTLIDIGSVWPGEASDLYWSNLLGPATGQCKNIRVLFGYEERPGALQPRGTPWTSLGTEVVAVTFSFILSPSLMPTLCALCSTCNEAAWTADAWDSTVVDTDGIRPQGAKAHVHWKVWKKGHVIHGRWADKNVGVLLCKNVRRWRFIFSAKCFGIKISISSALEEPKVIVHYKDRRHVLVAFATSQDAEAIVDAYLAAPAFNEVCTPFVKMGECRGCHGCAARSAYGLDTLELVGNHPEMKEWGQGSLASGASEAFYFVVVGEHAFRPVWELCA